MSGTRYLFFLLEPDGVPAPASDPGPGFRTVLWRPSDGGVAPRGARGKVFAAYWLMHRLRVFANRDYAQLAVYAGDALVHRSGAYPRFFRFPFMASADLQIGNTWTDPAYRGRGLAGYALRELVARTARPGRRFWYVVEEENAPSVRVIERAGFVLAGTGRRTARWGVRALGAYEMDAPASI